jgi:hypothetical protein
MHTTVLVTQSQADFAGTQGFQPKRKEAQEKCYLPEAGIRLSL